MTRYRCKHAVEAMRWEDTDANREAFCDWFDKHNLLFTTVGPTIILPESSYTDGEAKVDEGEWVVWDDDEFIAWSDEQFRETYEEVE